MTDAEECFDSPLDVKSHRLREADVDAYDRESEMYRALWSAIESYDESLHVEDPFVAMLGDSGPKDEKLRLARTIALDLAGPASGESESAPYFEANLSPETDEEDWIGERDGEMISPGPVANALRASRREPTVLVLEGMDRIAPERESAFHPVLERTKASLGPVEIDGKRTNLHVFPTIGYAEYPKKAAVKTRSLAGGYYPIEE